MIKSCGCKIVELGHAERFEYFNESDILINKKIIQALKYNITPLVCVGEKKFNSNYNLRKQGLRKKLNIFFKNITLKKNKEIILAYEPIWAIGKSKAANLKYISVFSLFTVIPSLIVAIFSLFIFNFGVQNYFDKQITKAVNNSYDVAKNYLQESKENVLSDVILMSVGLNRASSLYYSKTFY